MQVLNLVSHGLILKKQLKFSGFEILFVVLGRPWQLYLTVLEEFQLLSAQCELAFRLVVVRQVGDSNQLV